MSVRCKVVACCTAALAGLLSRGAAAQRKAATKGQEATAERLYAEAARLFQRRQLFELKATLERLLKQAPDAAVVADAARKPSVAEMLEAVKGLGDLLPVRRDGAAGAFRKVQDAIDAAAANSTVEIQDAGPYAERLVIPKEKTGLTLRGKNPLWPVIASDGQAGPLVVIEGAGTALEHLVLAHQGAAEGPSAALDVRGGPCTLQLVAIGARGAPPALAARTPPGAALEARACLVAGGAVLEGDAVLKDCLWPSSGAGGLRAAGAFKAENCLLPNVLTTGPAELLGCTVIEGAFFKGRPSRAANSILYKVGSERDDARIEHSNVFPAGFLGAALPGEGCFSAEPKFVDIRNLDYRLAPASPCRKKGSDGEDVGCRYTTEMADLAKKAIEFRARGLLPF